MQHDGTLTERRLPPRVNPLGPLPHWRVATDPLTHLIPNAVLFVSGYADIAVCLLGTQSLLVSFPDCPFFD